VTSTLAFIYTSADCVLNYISQQQQQQQQRHSYHGDEASDVSRLPAFTLCSLNPLRSAVLPRRQKLGENNPGVLDLNGSEGVFYTPGVNTPNFRTTPPASSPDNPSPQ